ncbi:hypothetical protein BJX96DRAFT_8330 [Aspergillus floccosus]
MYRTGDLARWHGDGSLEYLGRMDGRLELRGLRIEPSDIAMAAQSHPAVKACVVTKVQGPASTEALVAIAQVDTNTLRQQCVTAAQIQAAVAARVPEYMVPVKVQLQTTPLPQTSSGKLDHRAIALLAEPEYNRWLDAAPSGGASIEAITRAPLNSLEARIAHHWAAVLRMDEDTHRHPGAIRTTGRRLAARNQLVSLATTRPASADSDRSPAVHDDPNASCPAAHSW